jgi:DNA-binding transcriptional ArsR family regulator
MLPSNSADGEARAAEADPRVIGLDSDDADAALSALSSATSRTILGALHERPDTPAALGDRVDTSLQNVQYHLGKLADAGLIEVVDTVYSEKGREMKVYAPADRPLVVFAGSEDDSRGLASALKGLLGAVGVLALLSLLVQFALRGPPTFGGAGDAAGGSASGDVAVGTESVRTGAEAAGQALGVPPGVVFFAGGVAVLLGLLAVRYVRKRRAA